MPQWREKEEIMFWKKRENAANETATNEKRPTNWKRIAVVAAAGVVMAAVIAVVIIASNGGFTPRENDIYYKDSYTVSDSQLNRTMDKVVATIGPYSLTNRELQVYYWMQVIDFINYYGAYLPYYGLDYTKPLDEQYTDQEKEMTWQQYFLQEAIYSWNYYTLLSHQGELTQFQLPEEYQQTFENLYADLTETLKKTDFETIDEMLQAEMGPAANFEAYEKYLRNYYAGNEYLTDIYNNINPTDDEMEAYFAKNAEKLQSTYKVNKTSGMLATVRHILIVPEGGEKDENNKTVYSDAEWKVCRRKAQDLLDKWLEGDKTEKSFAHLAAEHSQDPGSKDSGGIYTRFAKGKMVAPFENWSFDDYRVKGDVGIVETEYGCHIMYFVEADEGWKLYSADGVRGEKITEKIAKWREELTMEVNYKKIALAEHTIGTQK